MRNCALLSALASSLALATLAPATTIFQDTFEGGTLAGWNLTPINGWTNSTSSPITGARSLKHNLTTATATSNDYVVTQLSYNLNTERTVWRFNLRNGNWDPSTANKFWVHLAASQSNLNGNTVSGYAVGVNLTGSGDLLTLWRVANGAAAATLVASSLDWNENTLAGIEVSRTTAGLWELSVDNNGGFDNLVSAGTATDTTYSNTTFFGLSYIYSSTRAGLLWWDDISIVQEALITDQPPTLTVPGPQVMVAGTTNSFAVAAEDMDNDFITLTASNLPANAFFMPTNGFGAAAGTFTFSPTLAQAGLVTNVLFHAQDNDGATSRTVQITVAEPAACGVLISEYVEGSSNNKAVEIFNGSDTNIDLAAEGYVLQIYANGGTSPSSTINLSGLLRSTKTHVVCNSGSGSALLALAHQTGNVNFNGDDAVVLRVGGSEGAVVDSFGRVGEDPGSGWGSPVVTVDRTLRRKLSVKSGDTTINDVFNPAVEWDVFPQDTFDGLRQHNNGCGTFQPPLATNQSISLIGDFNGFNPTATFMTLVDDYVWELSLANIQQAQNRFKFVANSNFTAGQWGELNQSNYLLPLNATAEGVTFGNDIVVSNDLSGFTRFTFNEQTLNYQIERAEPATLTFAGSFNATNLTPNLTLLTNSLWEGFFTLVGITNLQFKFFANADTAVSWGETNQVDFDLPLAGTAEPGADTPFIVVPETFSGVYRVTFDHLTQEYTMTLVDDAPITLFQDFNTWPAVSAFGTYFFEGWTVVTGLVDQLNARSGNAARLRNISPTPNSLFVASPRISKGLGSLSFWYRHWNGSGALTLVVEKSGTGNLANDAQWTNVSTVAGITTTNYTLHSVSLNDTNNFYVRIRKSAGVERLMIDDIFLTSDTNVAYVTISDVTLDPINPWTNDAVNISALVTPAFDAQVHTVFLHYRVGADTNTPFTGIEMVDIGGNRYAAASDIPPQPPNTRVFYYLRVDFEGAGSQFTSPAFYPPDGKPAVYGVPRNPPGSVWINEIDYFSNFATNGGPGGASTSMNMEFVELAGATGRDISGWSMELFDARSAMFITFDRYSITNYTLANDTGDGFGFFVLGGSNLFPRTILMTNRLSARLPGGVRLKNEFGGVEQAVSYGGAVTGFDNPSVSDVDHLDPFVFPYTNSIALIGQGSGSGEFTWSTNQPTPGAINHFQSFGDYPQMNCSNLAYSCTNLVPPATNFTGVSATGTCGNLTVTLSFVPPQTDNGGAGCPTNQLLIFRTYRAVSDCGTTSECVQVITVSDVFTPTIHSCATSVVVAADENCQALVPDFTNQVNATDGCGGPVRIAQSPPPGATVGAGDHIIVLAAIDPCGNTAFCVATVTVFEATPPVIVQCAPNRTTECRPDLDDNASNGPYINDGWQNGDAGGSGWIGGWSLTNSTTNEAHSGHLVQDSRTNGAGNDSNLDGDVNTTLAKAWGLYANNGALTEAFRRFEDPLLIGNTFSIDFDNGFVNQGGGQAVGLALQNHATGDTLLELLFVGGNANYSIKEGADVFQNTGLPYTDEGLRARLTLTSTNTYSAHLRRLVDDVSVTVTGVLLQGKGLPIDRLRLFNFNAGEGANYNVFYNRISVRAVPEADPSLITANDNCSAVTVTHQGDSAGGNACTQVLSRTYRAMDASGNFTNCVQTFTIVDSRGPELTGSTNFQFVADSGGGILLPDLTTNVTARDLCSTPVVTQVPTAGTYVAGGSVVSVHFIATDDCGNTNAFTAPIQLGDTFAPSNMICQLLDSNALLNAGFEGGGPAGSSIADWALFGNAFSEEFQPRGGAAHLKLFGNFNTNLNLSGAFQTRPAAPGQLWRVLAYALNPSSDYLRAGTEAFVKLEYFDAATNFLSARESRHVNHTMPSNQYVQLAIQATAPGGAAQVRAVCLFQQTADNPAGAIYFDDARLDPVQTDLAVTSVAAVPGTNASLISVEDAIDLTPSITYQGQVGNGGSGAAGDPLVLTRTWRATDDAANFVECQQVITVEASGGEPPPPTNSTVRAFVFSPTSITVRATGTNTWSAGPQYTTNLMGSQLWLSITSYSLSHQDGTNVLIFPPPSNSPPVFIRILNAE